MNNASHCGFVAIIGRPNVGKSTLLNHLIGQKVSITSRKPQTTRHRILGIKTENNFQAIYIDTPGLHQLAKRAMNRYMNRVAMSAMNYVDVLIFIIDALRFTKLDEWILEKIKLAKCPVILVLNKIDKIKEKDEILPLMKAYNEKMKFAAIIPLSAKNGDNVNALETAVNQLLPVQQYFYGEDQITDRSERFLAAEIVREKIIRKIGAEVPHAMTVQIESFKQEGKILHINALILVEKKGQKAIIIGKKGELLKEAGKQARLEMEKLFDQKVFLQLWVKVKEGWSDDERALLSLGYQDT